VVVGRNVATTATARQWETTAYLPEKLLFMDSQPDPEQFESKSTGMIRTPAIRLFQATDRSSPGPSAEPKGFSLRTR
jgi:hypothetical protein